MLSYTVYKLIHVLGIWMVFLALGGLILFSINGHAKSDNRWRRPAAITHGVGLFLVLLGGFGMLAKLGINWPWPGWIVGKVIVWLLFGGVIALIFRKPSLAKILWWVVLGLGVIAAYLVLWKPF